VYAEVLHTAPQAQTLVVAQCPWQTDRYTDAAYDEGRDRLMQVRSRVAPGSAAVRPQHRQVCVRAPDPV
jgi:hypothetical protein